LQKYGCLDVASVEEIKRQHGEYKQFVELVAAGKIQEAVDLLKAMGWVYEMDLAERKMALARDYVSAIEAGKTAQVVAPTHKECDEASASIRELLKEKGLLGKGTNWKTLRDLSWSDAQKRDPDHYQPGLVVQINDHVKGFALGEQIEIQQVDEKSVTGRDEKGRKCKIPLSEPKSFGVYERGSIEVCKGENLRVTANGRTEDRHRLYNGKTYKVDHIAPDGKIILQNGWRLDKDFKHVEYAYPETSHSIQGKTVDCVFVVQTAEFSSFASDQNQFYVSTSRGSDEMKLYTDTLELLVENVSEKRERLMATELINGVGQTVEAGIEEEDKISWQLGSLNEKLPPKALMEKIQRPDRKAKKKAPKSVEESIREPESASDILGTLTATQPEIIAEILEEIEGRRREKKQEPAMGLGM